MHEANLQEILIILLAAIFIVAIFRKFNLSPVLGYLVAGGIIGPFGLAFVKDTKTAEYLAEFGVVFLLFYIGLELTFDRLKSMRMHVFGLGTAQVLLTSLIIGIVCHYLGAGIDVAIIIGLSLALSSTAIVIQVLAEHGYTASQSGRLSLAVLILQDLAAVPLLIMIPLFAQEDISIAEAIGKSIFNTLVVLLIIVLVGRRLLRPLLKSISSLRSQELFLATTLLVVLGTAWLTNQAGLSLAMGAFVAGLLVAETEYKHQVETDIQPFKGLLMALFFITVGMSFNLEVLLEQLAFISLITVALIIVKAIIVIMLARVFGFRLGPATHAGLLLAQGSEFSFIILGIAATNKILGQEVAQLIMMSVSVTMAFTPMLSQLGKKMAKIIDGRDKSYLKRANVKGETKDLRDHIMVAGYGRVGRTICNLLSARNIGNYIAIDSNANKVHDGRKDGHPVYYGNADRIELLKTLGIERAKLIAITLNNRKETLKVVSAIHKSFPEIPIIARAWDRKNANDLRDAGATVAMAEAFESSLILGSSILKGVGVPENEIKRTVEQFRIEEYKASVLEEVFHISEDKATN